MNQTCSTSLFEFYRKELKRIGWRVQYKEKIKNKKEIINQDFLFLTTNFTNKVDNEIFINGLLSNLSSDVGRKIIEAIYIEGVTEKQVAKQLNMSQQGVNKWKRKMLKELSQMINS